MSFMMWQLLLLLAGWTILCSQGVAVAAVGAAAGWGQQGSRAAGPHPAASRSSRSCCSDSSWLCNNITGYVSI
jgi:hypothetical protein